MSHLMLMLFMRMFSFTARSKTCVIFVKSDLSGILFGVKYLWTVLNKMAWYGFQKI